MKKLVILMGICVLATVGCAGDNCRRPFPRIVYDGGDPPPSDPFVKAHDLTGTSPGPDRGGMRNIAERRSIKVASYNIRGDLGTCEGDNCRRPFPPARGIVYDPGDPPPSDPFVKAHDLTGTSSGRVAEVTGNEGVGKRTYYPNAMANIALARGCSTTGVDEGTAPPQLAATL
ncbi:MAG: hypothetical protein Q8Q12_05450 [bacterium]|nr:hypothetical protein [bacterium]